MDWSGQIFAYCERGTDPSFWAEPFNAISNAAFLLAAALALRQSRSVSKTRSGHVEFILAGLVAIIGIGSFVFHTFATRWAMIADVAPITIFMLAYLGYAVRRFMGLSWTAVAAAIICFVAAGFGIESVSCDGARCLNGSLGYVPALAAMMVIGGSLQSTEHPAAGLLLAAAATFAVSLVIRSIDVMVCPRTLIQPGWRTGTHAIWHVLNAITLYLLLRAAHMHGSVLRNRA